MFHIDDTILYGTLGICKIAEIAQKDFGGEKMDYYVLKPVYGGTSTVYVPMHNEALKEKMREVLTLEEIQAIIKEIPNEKPVWIESENERREKYREIIASGDRMELAKIIKALYLHQQKQQEKGRKLHVADERFFKDAEKMLYDEFALVLQIEPNQVLPFLLKQMKA